jgi:tetratricopeptide (TPR) repeat protein
MTEYDQLLREILDRGPSAETLGLVLTELKRLGHTRTVIQECIRALQNHPGDLSLRLILAEAYVEEGLFSQAEAEIQTTVSQLDRYASAYRLQSEIYRNQKRNEEALRSLKTYLALRPQDERALDLLKEMEIPEAAPAPEVATIQEEITEPIAAETTESPVPNGIEPLEVEAEKPELRLDEEVLSEIATPTLAEVYVNQGQIQEAVRIYEKVIAQNPGDQASVTRLQELRDMRTAEPSPPRPAPSAEQRKERERSLSWNPGWLTYARCPRTGFPRKTPTHSLRSFMPQQR